MSPSAACGVMPCASAARPMLPSSTALPEVAIARSSLVARGSILSRRSRRRGSINRALMVEQARLP